MLERKTCAIDKHHPIHFIRMRERECHRGPAAQRITDYGGFANREFLTEAVQKIDQHAHAIVCKRLVGRAEADLVRDKNVKALSERGNGGGPVGPIATESMQKNHGGAGPGLEIVNLLTEDEDILWERALAPKVPRLPTKRKSATQVSS